MAEDTFQQSNPSETLNPAFREEDQEMAQELAPMVVGPPAYASPDPKTTEGALVPVEQHPNADMLSEDYGGGLAEVSPGFATTQSPEGGAGGALSDDVNDWKAGDWTDKIEATDDLEVLGALYEQYEASDADFVTVQKAFEKREDELTPDK